MNLSRRAQRLLLCNALVLWCAILLVARLTTSPAQPFRFLFWNLFLAALPLVFATGFRTANTKIVQLSYFVLWLLFFPNAPYLLTDLFHLRTKSAIQSWLDLVVLLSCAGTGIVLGFYSLADIQETIGLRLGKAKGWLVAISSLALCSYGIYVGRFLRFNSWEAFTNPIHLAKSLAFNLIDPTPFPHAVVITSVFTVSLLFGYSAFRLFSR